MTTTTAELTGEYTIDTAHSRVGFVARHAMVTKVRGAFNDWEGSAHIDGTNPGNSSARVTIQAKSIDTRNSQRDEHLRSNDFLDMSTHPEITFVSTAVEQLDDSTFRMTGDLTVRGVTRPVSIDFDYVGAAVDPYGNRRVGLEGSVAINRKDFGVTWNAALEGGGVLVSEKIVLEIEVSAIRNA
ncbi:polyisoprenoid-binding protein YceI [Kribbella pratensis]|uniref:Polyisoprenoid-binding protein YceI n=1 Tax=Kribbella pratensis TaxID=2512112 RepID=A0ABY2FHU0_9ACTN|nr:YceI family protein [Kribbella pratensis]TDW90521.1 polyisoprenoid-binding protein YceI [Kribbella pratensis]